MPCGAPTTITMHAVTGAFTDARVESAFTSQLFRAAFPVHALLMAIVLALWTWKAFDSTFSLGYFVTFQLPSGLALMGRVLVHMMRDTVRGQRTGSWLWIALIAAVCISDMMQGPDCSPLVWYVNILVCLSFSLINGSHGLGFAAKFSLISLFLVDIHAAMIACDEGSEANKLNKCAMGVIVLGSVCAHLAELQLRRNYAEKAQEMHRVAQLEERNEQLQGEKERMMYDMQRRGSTALDDENRSAICRGLHAGPASDSGRTDPELAEAAIAAEAEKQSKRRSSQPLHPEINAHAPSESLLASLPPGAPSSPTSASTASSIAEADRQHYAEIAAQRAAEQKAPRLKWVETGRQFAKSVGTKRGRAALIEPARLEPGASPGVERVELAELAELAGETDEEVMRYLVVRHLLPAAEADQKKAGAMAVVQQSVTSHIPAASSPAAFPCSSIFLQQYLPAVPVLQNGALQNMFHPRPLRSCHAAPEPSQPQPQPRLFPVYKGTLQDMNMFHPRPLRSCHAALEPSQPQPQPRLFPVYKGTLQDMFATLVMRDYTPRRPGKLPTSRWVSCN